MVRIANVIQRVAERLGTLNRKPGVGPHGRGHKVRPGQPEVLCNPLAQAELLDREDRVLVLLMGQCVGHDAATLTRLKAPAVCLVAKDRVLAHNTVAGLYAY